MELSNENQINLYFHCKQCIEQMPNGVSPRDWVSIEAGWTELGLQVRCKRHNCNICNVDFEGQQHPAVVTA